MDRSGLDKLYSITLDRVIIPVSIIEFSSAEFEWGSYNGFNSHMNTKNYVICGVILRFYPHPVSLNANPMLCRLSNAVRSVRSLVPSILIYHEIYLVLETT